MQRTIFWFLGCVVLVASIAGSGRAEVVSGFFNGKNLDGWQGNRKYWSVQDGEIVGESKADIPGNEFLWSPEKVENFYLSFRVKLTPDSGNSGVQFRSRPGAGGFAIGYQADIGKGSWGCLYEEHGRAFLDWPTVGEKQVRPGAWNQYEILAVGHRIWTAINGVISVAIDDPQGALSGQISLQLHAGPPLKLQFADLKLVKDPPLEIAGKKGKELLDTLRPRIEKVGSLPKIVISPSMLLHSVMERWSCLRVGPTPCWPRDRVISRRCFPGRRVGRCVFEIWPGRPIPSFGNSVPQGLGTGESSWRA